MADAVVEVEGLVRTFGAFRALDGVDLTLRRGNVLGLLGPNGAGKTTTMSVLSGNLAPTSGRVTIAGHDILDAPNEAKSRLGYLPELPPLYTDLTVDEYLVYTAGLRGVPRAERAAACDRAKDRCGLGDTGPRLIGNLSKGYQQRVGIAQAIIHDPLVVILDEPTVGLDPIQVRGIRALIAELGREHGVILSTHILPEVQATCTDVAIIHRGRLVYSESMAAVDDRLGTTTLVLETATPADHAALGAVPGVERVETLGDHRVRLHHGGIAAVADAVARVVVERGWGLVELAPERKTLEQVFVELTTTDAAA